MSSPPVILSIAGSDPSGGAGIQADIKAVSAMGCYAAAAITAVTVQNTCGVSDVEYLSPELVAAQVAAVVTDLKPRAVKIGMTGTAGIIAAVSEVLRRGECRNVVLDPVMVSTSGRSLAGDEILSVMCRELFPLCRLVTPNLGEVSLLSGYRVSTTADMENAARALNEKYGCAFLVKGGHLEGGEMVDVLADDGILYRYSSPRIETGNLHGTGCTLSSAIAALLGRGLSLSDAVGEAKRYMDCAIAAASDMHIGCGNGPLWHFPNFK